MKIEKKRLSVADSRCRQNVKLGDFTSSLHKGPQKYLVKSVLFVQQDYHQFYSMIIIIDKNNDNYQNNDSYHFLWPQNKDNDHCFVALFLPSPSSFLKLPNAPNVSFSNFLWWYYLTLTNWFQTKFSCFRHNSFFENFIFHNGNEGYGSG